MQTEIRCFTPTNKDLSCHVVSGQDGVGRTLTATLTYEQFVEFFNIADISIDEHAKLQRDPTRSRVKNIREYLVERQNTYFPGINAVVTQVEVEYLDVISLNDVSRIGVMTLKAGVERMLFDGQGRRLGIEEALALKGSLKGRTVTITFLETQTDTLEQGRDMIRQLFSDIHKSVVKPNSSINLFFDSSQRSSTFVMAAYEKLKAGTSGFHNYISLDGNQKRIWTLAQFKTFLRKFTGMTDNDMNNLLEDDELVTVWLKYIDVLCTQLSALAVFSSLDDSQMMSDAKYDNLLCCAIGIEALGVVGRVIIDNAIRLSEKPDFASLSKLSTLDLSKENDAWVDQVISKERKMIKGSASKFAMHLASHCDIPLSTAFIQSLAS